MRPDGAYDRARLNMAGEALLIVEFGAVLSAAINDAVLAFDQFLQENSLEGLYESAPVGRSVTLRFDPLIIAPEKFRATVREFVDEVDWFDKTRAMDQVRWQLPVCYGGQAGTDLELLAAHLNMSIDDVIMAHSSVVQRVFMIGFAPGFLYTGKLPNIFDVPRLASIKPLVRAGSVSVAIGQSVISSTPHSTGWHTLGRTPFRNFDPLRDPALMINAGDEISFFQIDQREYVRLRGTADQGLIKIDAQEQQNP